MYDKELIQKVCELTCSKEDVVRDQTTIKYNTENPFKTYYNVSTLTGAFKKYIANEWDDQTLAHWACIYCWVLCGGFDDNVKFFSADKVVRPQVINEPTALKTVLNSHQQVIGTL